MSLTAILLATGDSAARPSRGRPRVDADPQSRQLHIAAVLARKAGVSLADVCRRFEVSPRTVQLWARRVRSYPEACGCIRAD